MTVSVWDQLSRLNTLVTQSEIVIAASCCVIKVMWYCKLLFQAQQSCFVLKILRISERLFGYLRTKSRQVKWFASHIYMQACCEAAEDGLYITAIQRHFRCKLYLFLWCSLFQRPKAQLAIEELKRLRQQSGPDVWECHSKTRTGLTGLTGSQGLTFTWKSITNHTELWQVSSWLEVSSHDTARPC